PYPILTSIPPRRSSDLALGYVANPAGPSFVDGGVGSFLTKGHLLSQPSVADSRWVKFAPDNQARFQVPTLRNVDKRLYPAFVKADRKSTRLNCRQQINS